MDKKHISEKIEEVTERAERTLVEEGAASEAAVYFEGLLREQIARAERLAKAEPPKDFTALDKITIGLCPGDGIGPIIMRETRRVLEALLADELQSGRIVFKRHRGTDYRKQRSSKAIRRRAGRAEKMRRNSESPYRNS